MTNHAPAEASEQPVVGSLWQSEEPIKTITALIALVVNLLIGASLYFNLNNVQQSVLTNASTFAKTIWNKDLVFRQWATRHGGLYVRPDDRTPPNPYLAHLPHRDVETTDGIKLTLMNPAYMMRQMAQEFEADYGIKGKITGKIQLNPINKPDDWELQVLDRFEQNLEPVLEQQLINGQPHVRYMKPMIMTEGCVACHGHLGFKDGDLRGGISVSVPIMPYVEAAAPTIRVIVMSHGAVWLLGMLGVFYYYRSAKKRRDIRQQLQRVTQQQQQKLADKVYEQTQELREKERLARESMQRLNQLIDSAADGIITTDHAGDVLSCNKAAAELFGYSASDLVGENVSKLVPDVYAGKHQQHIEQYLANGNDKIAGLGREVRGLKKDGSLVPLQISISKLKLEGEVLFTAMIHDIREQIEHEEDLIQAKNRAEQASSAKNEFLSSMSHELRTPLNAVLGFSELLQMDEKLNDEQRHSIDLIRGAGVHLLELIEDVLCLSKIEANRMEIFPADIDIKRLLDECHTLLKPIGTEHDVHAELKYQSMPTTFVEADATRLKQVILNLMSNAIKYNHAGGTVTIDCCQGRTGFLKVVIQDTGRGIAAEKIQYLFQPFERLGVHPGEVEGTGIGLAISKKLIELMGGEIGACSVVGKGSTFWIEIPLAPLKEKCETTEPDKPQQASDKPLQGTVVCVEDNPVNLMLVEKIISGIEGIEMHCATDGESGLQLIRELNPDIVLLDINLPGISGLEAVRQLKADPATADISVFALSAAATDEDIKRGLMAGFEAYFTKPINIPAMVTAIVEVLQGPAGDAGPQL